MMQSVSIREDKHDAKLQCWFELQTVYAQRNQIHRMSRHIQYASHCLQFQYYNE